RPRAHRHRSRAGHAARQAQALRQLQTGADSMKLGHAAPPVRRRSTIGPDQAKNQDQSQSQNQNQNQNRSKKGKPTEVCGPRVPPVGRPRGSEKFSERRFSSQYSPALVQAHSSMRICWAAGPGAGGQGWGLGAGGWGPETGEKSPLNQAISTVLRVK